MKASPAAATAHPLHLGHDADCRSPQPVWARALTFDVAVLHRLGIAMLASGTLLAFTPIHPGLVCPLRASTGIPCPFCGMTTSVKACLQMDLAAAFAANPGGIAAVATALVLMAWRPRSLRVPIVALALAGTALWVFQLFRFQVL